MACVVQAERHHVTASALVVQFWADAFGVMQSSVPSPAILTLMRFGGFLPVASKMVAFVTFTLVSNTRAKNRT